MFHHRERGQGLVENGLIVATVAVLAIAALLIFGTSTNSLLSNSDAPSRRYRAGEWTPEQ